MMKEERRKAAVYFICSTLLLINPPFSRKSGAWPKPLANRCIIDFYSNRITGMEILIIDFPFMILDPMRFKMLINTVFCSFMSLSLK